jgi:hypothetical protein
VATLNFDLFHVHLISVVKCISRGAYRILVGRPEGHAGVDGRIISKLILKKWNGWRAWTGLVWLTIGTLGGLL